MTVAKRRSATAVHVRGNSAEPAGFGAKEPLQIRIPVGIKRRFKSYAALKGMEPNELFVEVWERYEKELPALPIHNAGTRS